MELIGTEPVDLLVLGRADPAARFNGLAGALPLWQDEAGRWGAAQMASTSEVFDTEWLRRAALERTAGSSAGPRSRSARVGAPCSASRP